MQFTNLSVPFDYSAYV